jgi:hypothetical protein
LGVVIEGFVFELDGDFLAVGESAFPEVRAGVGIESGAGVFQPLNFFAHSFQCVVEDKIVRDVRIIPPSVVNDDSL